ncbi:MAG: hypothetical protein V4733_03750 [Verrucomicrobiota bacterium]
MIVCVDLDTLQLIKAPGVRVPISALKFKRGDAARLDVLFLAAGTTPVRIADFSAALALTFGVKAPNDYDGLPVVLESDWTEPTEVATDLTYFCSPSFNTTELNALLGIGGSPDVASITLMGEITWAVDGSEPTSTRTFAVIVENDVVRGDEGAPNPAYTPDDDWVAHGHPQSLTPAQQSQAQANIGLPKNNHAATAAPTVNDDSGDGFAIGSLWIKTTAPQEAYRCVSAAATAAVWIETTLDGTEVAALIAAASTADRARATHTGTQALVTISDAGTAAALNVPATGDATSGQVVKGSDTRLADARTPTAHTHDDRYYTETENDVLLAAKDTTPTADKTTPADADKVSIYDSAAAGVRKWLSLANLWLFVKSKLDAGQTFAGTQTLTGQLELPGQDDLYDTSAINRKLMDDAFADPSIFRFREDFFGGTDGDTMIGQNRWSVTYANGTGTTRPQTPANVFGGVGLVTPAARRGLILAQPDYSNLLGGGGWIFANMLNSSLRWNVRFQVDTLAVSSKVGFGSSGTTFLGNRFFGLRYYPASAAWQASTAIALNEYRRPVTANGRRYYASVAGTTSGTQPTWPTTPGGTVVDGGVTWTEGGADGHANLKLVSNGNTADELAATVVDTGVAVAANTWITASMRFISSSTFAVSINGGAEVNINMSSGDYNNQLSPTFAAEASTATAAMLAADYFITFARNITR